MTNLYWLIISLSTKLLGHKVAKGPCGLQVKLPQPKCLLHALEASQCPFLLLNVKQESFEYQFYSVTFDLIRNRTRVHQFNYRRSIHSIINKEFAFSIFLALCIVSTKNLQVQYFKRNCSRSVLLKK